MRKNFSTNEFLNVVNLMHQADYGADVIAEKTGMSKKSVERQITVGRNEFFYGLVKENVLKYTTANSLISGTPDDKMVVLESAVRKWKIATDKKIEAARERMVNSNKTPSGPKLQHSTYLPSWLVKNWLVAIEEGLEPQVDGVWRFGLLHDPEKRTTSVPAVTINYDKDPLDRLIDIYWKYGLEIERLEAAIDTRKLHQAAVAGQSEYGDKFKEMVRSKGLEKYVHMSTPAPDAEIPDLDEPEDENAEQHLDDIEDLLEAPDAE